MLSSTRPENIPEEVLTQKTSSFHIWTVELALWSYQASALCIIYPYIFFPTARFRDFRMMVLLIPLS